MLLNIFLSVERNDVCGTTNPIFFTPAIFSDNFFDLLPGESKTVLVEEIRSCENVDVAELQKELQILSNYDIALQSN